MYRDPDDYEGTPTAEQQEHIDAVRNCHRALEDGVAGVVDGFIKRGRMVTKRELACIAEAISEALADDRMRAVESLAESGWEAPEQDEGMLVEREFRRLADSFRIKPIDGMKLLKDALRPVATNPFTRGGL